MKNMTTFQLEKFIPQNLAISCSELKRIESPLAHVACVTKISTSLKLDTCQVY